MSTLFTIRFQHLIPWEKLWLESCFSGRNFDLIKDVLMIRHTFECKGSIVALLVELPLLSEYDTVLQIVSNEE